MRELEKGVKLSKSWLDENEAVATAWLNHWMLYPDLFLDTIQKIDDKYFQLYFYQRIALRASMRYRYHYLTATRATSKSFIAFLSAVLRSVFLPGAETIIVADVKGTVIQIAKKKLSEIWEHWPLLEKEVKTRADDGEQGVKKGSDYFEMLFKNDSKLFVISKDSARGIRANGAIVEECATMEEEPYNNVVLPILNIPRREVDGSLNPEEPLSPQIMITTAGPKTCFFYSKLIECAAMEVLRPDEYFVWGGSLPRLLEKVGQ